MPRSSAKRTSRRSLATRKIRKIEVTEEMFIPVVPVSQKKTSTSMPPEGCRRGGLRRSGAENRIEDDMCRFENRTKKPGTDGESQALCCSALSSILVDAHQRGGNAEEVEPIPETPTR